MRPITSARRKCLPVLLAALLLTALSVACTRGGPTPAPTPAPTSEDISTIIADAVATAVAEVKPDATPNPGPTPTSGAREDAIATAVANALAATTTAAGPTPNAGPTVDASAEATATAAARINAAAAALNKAVGIAVDSYFNGPYRNDLEGSIAHAVSMTNADADAVTRAMNEVLSSFGARPIPVDPAAKDMSDELSAAVTLALKYIIRSPLDREGAVAHAVSMTNADPNAVADALNKVLDNPIGFPNLDTETAVAAANAVAEVSAIADARDRADDAEAANQATASAYAEYIATATAVAPAPTPTYAVPEPENYDAWNDHEWLAEPKPWWRDSNPYDCDPPPNPQSPWTPAGLPDLEGQDPLSLIRYFGNGSYVRYGLMGFEGCTFMSKYPDRTHLDPPVDPTYYSLGDLEIAVDITRVPVGAPDWTNDNGVRVDMSMSEAVNALNTHVAAYFGKISQGKLRMSFVPGVEFTPSGLGTPQDVQDQWLALAGVVGCDPNAPDAPGCRWGMPGALNRLLLDDVGVSSGGSAWNGSAEFGLVSLQTSRMTTLVHEIGHGWMFWPHSYIELPWRPDPNKPYQKPNFYSNVHDFMSELSFARPTGWYQDMPSTLAINRYAAGWIAPEDVALHLSEQATYTLAKPREKGYQFLVIHSGRAGAFTTLEVLDERNAIYRDTSDLVYDSARPGQRRPLHYEGVLVSRYDQTTGAGVNARTGPALYNTANPDYESDVGYGRDDYSVIADGESRSIGSGVTVSVAKNRDGSYDVRVSGGRIAEYESWCVPIWFTGEYDTDCLLADFDFGNAN